MNDRIETFTADAHYLVRSVVPARGKPYEHRCPRTAYEVVAYAAEVLSTKSEDPSFTLEELARVTGTPSTQTAVALAFMKERGCVVTRYRRNYAASSFLYEEAMIEYWALAEGSPGSRSAEPENTYPDGGPSTCVDESSLLAGAHDDD